MSNSIIKTVMGFHMDVFGHVNNACYLEFYEEARWLLYEKPISLLISSGIALNVVNVNINYRAPLSLFDQIKISADVTHVGNRSAVMHQTITSIAGDRPYSDADFTIVFVDEHTKTSIVINENPHCLTFIESMKMLRGKDNS